MDLNTIAEYVQRYREGDTEAFEELYKLTSSRVYFVCLNMLGSAQDANDAMQDTYLTACKNIRKLNDPKSFPSWVERIAINRCKDILKKKTPTPVDDELFKETLLAEDELTLPEEYILKADKRKTLLKIMREQLSELQFQTVILYYFSNLSIAETAEVMGCSEGAVMNRLAVSRAKIKKYVEGQERNTGSKLFVFAGVPFLTKLFAEECKTIGAPALSTAVLGQAAAMTKSGSAAATAAKAGLGVISKKSVIIAAVAAVITVGTVIGVSAGKKAKEPQELLIPEDFYYSELEQASKPEASRAARPQQEELPEDYSHLIGNPYDFAADDIPEADGHILQEGGCASVYRDFVVTDDNKVYIKHDAEPFRYFCTVDSDFEELTSLTNDGDDEFNDQLIVRNKDGSYLYYNASLEKPLKFTADGLKAAEYDENVLYLYMLDGDKVYTSALNSDGSIKTERTPVMLDTGNDREREYTPLENIKDIFLFNYDLYVMGTDGSMYEIFRPYFGFDDKAPEGVHLAAHDLEMPENTDRILSARLDIMRFIFNKTDDKNNLYVRHGTYDTLEPENSCITIPLPDGVTTDDIEKVLYCYDTYIVTKDKRIYSCATPDYHDSEVKWKTHSSIDKLYGEGKILDFYRVTNEYSSCGAYALCDDHRLYEVWQYDYEG